MAAGIIGVSFSQFQITNGATNEGRGD